MQKHFWLISRCLFLVEWLCDMRTMELLILCIISEAKHEEIHTKLTSEVTFNHMQF